jgi:hypothetical protein
LLEEPRLETANSGEDRPAFPIEIEETTAIGEIEGMWTFHMFEAKIGDLGLIISCR